MQYTIALAGKGGTGKTTMAGLLVKYLVKKNKTPILAVDADCNSNFNEVLGHPVKVAVGHTGNRLFGAFQGFHVNGSGATGPDLLFQGVGRIDNFQLVVGHGKFFTK